MLTGNTLDHCDAVDQLTGAMPDIENGDRWDRRELATELVVALNRAGLALVRLEPRGTPLRQQAEESFFGRKED